MMKSFVLDTNVLLHDPRALLSFEDNEVVVPISVVEEVDSFKKDPSELGRNAREVARMLDQLRADGQLSEGVPVDGGGTVRVSLGVADLPLQAVSPDRADNHILACAWHVHLLGQEAERSTIFVTKDVNLRVRADAMGLVVEDFDAERADIGDLYAGIIEMQVAAAEVGGLAAGEAVALPDPYHFPNQFVVLCDRDDAAHQALGKVDVGSQTVVPLVASHQALWGIRPRNREQTFAVEALTNDALKLVTLVGKAGTGKTLLAIAAGLHKVAEEHAYQRLLICRPVYPLGRDIGFLPGDIEEKLTPWMQPIFDNVEFLMGLCRGERKSGRSYHELMDLGILEIEPLTYIRGRSIPNQFMIVDEAQNLTPHEVKTIISRAGENTKIVLTGDPYQIDNPYVDATNNGLVHAVNRFCGEAIAGHLTLRRGERSPLAELATNLL